MTVGRPDGARVRPAGRFSSSRPLDGDEPPRAVWTTRGDGLTWATRRDLGAGGHGSQGTLYGSPGHVVARSDVRREAVPSWGRCHRHQRRRAYTDARRRPDGDYVAAVKDTGGRRVRRFPVRGGSPRAVEARGSRSLRRVRHARHHVERVVAVPQRRRRCEDRGPAGALPPVEAPDVVARRPLAGRAARRGGLPQPQRRPGHRGLFRDGAVRGLRAVGRGRVERFEPRAPTRRDLHEPVRGQGGNSAPQAMRKGNRT